MSWVLNLPNDKCWNIQEHVKPDKRKDKWAAVPQAPSSWGHNKLTKCEFLEFLPYLTKVGFFFPPQNISSCGGFLSPNINENHKYLIWDCSRWESSELALNERKKRLVCCVGFCFKFPGTEYLPFFPSTTTSTSTRQHGFFNTFAFSFFFFPFSLCLYTGLE